MIRSLIGWAAALMVLAPAARALEVDPNVLPEINLGGQAVVTGNYLDHETAAGESDGGGELDISDSSLVFDFAKNLFGDRQYAFATIGIKAPEDDSDLDDEIFIHQLHLGIGGADWEARLGRTRLPASLIQFPTLRDSDLLGFTHVANASSNGDAEEDTIYGGLLVGSYYFGGPWALSAALTARAETEPSRLDDRERERDNPNGLFLGVAYDLPEAVKFDRGLRFAGIGVDLQRVDNLAGADTDTVTSILAGLTYNLSEDPASSWAIDAQAIATIGGTVPSLAEPLFRARADSYSLVGAIRYAARPFLQTRWQAALVGAYKSFTESGDADAFALAPTFAWHVGSGIDLVAQYRYTDYSGALARGLDRDHEHALFGGLRFAIDYTLNETVGGRGSILQLEHDILDIGPIGGGH